LTRRAAVALYSPMESTSEQSAKPSPQRLAAFAVAILEEAAIAARHGSIKRTVAHRLALGWLAYIGISEAWKTERFWNLLGSAECRHRPDGQYVRDQELGRCLNGWRRLVGLAPKDDWYR
jgi:hypothetical protein